MSDGKLRGILYIMFIYHGSDVAVHIPKILSANRFLDFGEGFYTTYSYEQASSWARRVRDNRNSVSCRTGKTQPYTYDIAMGPVANDNVYETIRLFETGILSEHETIIRLKIAKIYNQILFHTEQSLNYCVYIRHENIKEIANE